MAALMLAVGDGAAAEVETRKALDLGYDPVEGQLLLARAYLRQGKYAGALESLAALDGKKLTPAQASARLAIGARAALGERDLDGAAARAEQALSLLPGSAEALDAKVRILDARGDRAGARQLAQTAAQANPAHGPLWQQLGDLARADGDAAAAVDAYTRAISSQLDNRDALTGRAIAFVALGEYGKARADVDTMRAGNAKDSLAAFLDGFVLLKEGRTKEAKDALELSVGGSPDAVDAVYLLGVAQLQLNELEQAQTRFEHAVALAPDHLQALLLLGATRMERGDYDGAMASARAVLARDPANTLALELASKAALRKGAGQTARGYVEQLLAADPKASRHHLAMGLSLLAEGKTPAGIAAIEQARRLEPTRVDNDVALIQGLIAEKQYDRALRIATELEAKLPGKPLPFVLQGAALGAAKRWDESRAAFQKAWELTPGDPGVARALAAIAASEGKTDDAIAYLSKAALDPAAPAELVLELAQLKLAKGDAQGFEADARRALAAAPGNVEARVLLMRLLLNMGRAAEAARLATEASSAARSNEAFLETAGTALLSYGRPADALGFFETLARRRPGKAQPLFLEGLTRAGLGQLDQARDALNAALRLEPQSTQVLVALADVEIRAGRLDAAGQAVARAEKAGVPAATTDALKVRLAVARKDANGALAASQRLLAAQPTTQNLLSLMGLYVWADRRADAEKVAADWLVRNPGDAAVAVALAEAQSKAGRREATIATYRQFLERRPDDAIVLNNLASAVLETDPAEALRLAERAYGLAPNAPAIADTYAWTLHRTGSGAKARDILSRLWAAGSAQPTIGYHYAAVLAQAGDVAGAKIVLEGLPPKGFPEAADAARLLGELREREAGAAAEPKR